jgi:predicted RNase H-like HicB family nuclease
MPTSQSKAKGTDNVAGARYPIEVFYSEDDGGFIAIAKDLPGCSAFGKTAPEAAAEIQDAIKAWLQAANAAGNPIPEPSRHVDETSLPGGKILLRIPRSLHASLIECAKIESVSLNQYLVSVLSGSVVMTPLREARNIVASMIPTGGIIGGLAYTRYLLPTGPNWRILGQVTETVVRPGEPLDVRTLTAGKPVVLGVE